MTVVEREWLRMDTPDADDFVQHQGYPAPYEPESGDPEPANRVAAAAFCAACAFVGFCLGVYTYWWLA